jgi:SAM-dependent methyltransferase
MTKDYLWLHLRELPYFRSILRAVEASFYAKLDLPHPILDVGSGDGHFATVAFEEQLDIGVDLHRKSIREAQERGMYRLLLQSDGARIPLASDSVASAVSNSVLEHMPQLDAVLAEVGRVLRPGGSFVFTVPNPGYKTELSVPHALRMLKVDRLARAYERWFMWMSRTYNMMYEEDWARRLAPAGFEIERTFRYFSPAALHVLEWGHYFGAPCILPRVVTGRWIIAPARWNLWLTDRLVRRYYQEQPSEHGTYSFYLVRKK